MLKKLNFETGEYEDYTVPTDWNITVSENDLNRKVQCASCGKKIKFGNAFPSKRIFSSTMDFSYAICKDCAFKERSEYSEPRKKPMSDEQAKAVEELENRLKLASERLSAAKVKPRPEPKLFVENNLKK